MCCTPQTAAAPATTTTATTQCVYGGLLGYGIQSATAVSAEGWLAVGGGGGRAREITITGGNAATR